MKRLVAFGMVVLLLAVFLSSCKMNDGRVPGTSTQSGSGLIEQTDEITEVENETETDSRETETAPTETETPNLQNELPGELKGGVSWANLQIDDDNLKLTEDQKKLVEYYDNNYFSIRNYELLQRHPKLITGAKIQFWGTVEKVLNTDDENYEILVHFQQLAIGKEYSNDELNFIGSGSRRNDDNYVVIKGKHSTNITNNYSTGSSFPDVDNKGRIIQFDKLTFYGRMTGIDEYEIDGKTNYYPTINAYRSREYVITADGDLACSFNLAFIKEIAKAIFGDNIKIEEGDSTDEFHWYLPYYLVTLDNQSKSDFSSFEFGLRWGYIRDSRVSRDSERQFLISADFSHYLVLTYNKGVKICYLDYYDRDLNKEWGRSFDNADSITMDYTGNRIYLVADNDLYILNASTGDDAVSPSYVGEKIDLMVVEDGIILVGTGVKDNVMKTDLEGNIIWKTSLNVNMEGCLLQVLDGNYVLQTSEYGWDAYYYLLGPDGNVLEEADNKEVVVVDDTPPSGQDKSDWKVVSVSVDWLYVRSGPGTDYPVISEITDEGNYLITEIKPGAGSTSGWGKISSDPEGWIALDYVDIIEG